MSAPPPWVLFIWLYVFDPYEPWHSLKAEAVSSVQPSFVLSLNKIKHLACCHRKCTHREDSCDPQGYCSDGVLSLHGPAAVSRYCLRKTPSLFSCPLRVLDTCLVWHGLSWGSGFWTSHIPGQILIDKRGLWAAFKGCYSESLLNSFALSWPKSSFGFFCRILGNRCRGEPGDQFPLRWHHQSILGRQWQGRGGRSTSFGGQRDRCAGPHYATYEWSH